MLRKLLIVLGLILLLCKQYIVQLPATTSFYIFLIGIILLGIPHGAADLLVANKNAKLENKSFSSGVFLFYYVLRIIIFGILFYLFPLIGFIFFLILAALHFGETDLYHIKLETAIGKAVVGIYGCAILSILLLTHLEEVQPIIKIIQPDLVTTNLFLFLNNYKFDIIFSLLVAFFVSLFIYQIRIRENAFPIEKILITLSFTAFLLYKMPLIIGFTFYFVIWHSILSIQKIVQYIQYNSVITVKKIILQIVMYSSISFIGIAIFGYSGFMFSNQDFFMSYIFIALAVLTVPHMQVLQSMYIKLRTQKG